MRKRYLECGKIVSTHGVRGEVKVQPWCDSPEYLCEFSTLYYDSRGSQPVAVKAARPHKGMVLLVLEGISDLDAATALRGKVLYLDRENATEDDAVFLQDLMGLVVSDVDTGERYGTIADVLETGANHVYDIRTEAGKQLLIPAIPDVVIETDVEGGVMKIRPLEGLFDAD